MDFVLSQIIFRPKQMENRRTTFNDEEFPKYGKGTFIPGLN
jgi:hypothetical protein